MRQAPSTVAVYFWEMVGMLDRQFGEGYAAKNPELLGQLVKACAQDMATTAQVVAGQFVAEAIQDLGARLRDHLEAK